MTTLNLLNKNKIFVTNLLFRLKVSSKIKALLEPIVQDTLVPSKSTVDTKITEQTTNTENIDFPNVMPIRYPKKNLKYNLRFQLN